MENRESSKKEIDAVNALISRIPAEDLKKAVGGLTDSQKKKLVAIGIVAAGIVAGTVFLVKNNESEEVGGMEQVLRPDHCYYNFYNSDGTLKDGYIKDKTTGKIYAREQLEPANTLHYFSNETWIEDDKGGKKYKVLEGAVAYPFDGLHLWRPNSNT